MEKESLRQFTDEDVYAYALGELDEQKRDALEKERLKDPELEKRVVEALELAALTRTSDGFDEKNFDEQFGKIDLDQKFSEIWERVQTTSDAKPKSGNEIKAATKRKISTSTRFFQFATCAAVALCVYFGVSTFQTPRTTNPLTPTTSNPGARSLTDDDFGKGITLHFDGHDLDATRDDDDFGKGITTPPTTDEKFETDDANKSTDFDAENASTEDDARETVPVE